MSQYTARELEEILARHADDAGARCLIGMALAAVSGFCVACALFWLID